MICTVPTIVPAASSAASTTRSPRVTLVDVLCQYASALARDMGSMKPTDAPPSTQSISTSLNPRISRSAMVGRQRICAVSGTSSPCHGTRALGRHDHDVARGLAGTVAKRGALVELHSEAVVFRE